MPAPPGNLVRLVMVNYGNYLNPAHAGLFLQINLPVVSIPNASADATSGFLPNSHSLDSSLVPSRESAFADSYIIRADSTGARRAPGWGVAWQWGLPREGAG